MVLEEKSGEVEEIKEILQGYKSIGIASLKKVRASQLQGLKKTLGDKVYMRVLKNTLARRAVQGTPFEALGDKMVGPLVYSISSDAVAAAKVVYDFARTNDKLVVKAGSYNGKVLDAAGVNALATVPSKEVLLAQLCGLLQSPVSGLARAIAAVSEQKAGATA